MGDRIERAQLAAGLMGAHGRLRNTGHGISLDYQPLAGLDESGNTAIITFHVAIVAIPAHVNYICPAGPRLGKVQPWAADALLGQRRPTMASSGKATRSLLKQSHHHKKHSFQHLSHTSSIPDRPASTSSS